MKNLDLKKFNVQEMDFQDMAQTNGGSLWGLIKAGADLVANVVETAYNAGSDMYHGLKEGWAEGKSHERPIVN